jgi:hypothetical protein
LVKTGHFYFGLTDFLSLGHSSEYAEPPVQQEETPQPPPEKPPDESDCVSIFAEPEEQQKEDIIFFVSAEEQFGHVVSFSLQPMFCRRENRSLHVMQIYS